MMKQGQKTSACIGLALATVLANASIPPKSLHVTLRYDSELARSTLQRMHDACLTASHLPAAPLAPSELSSAYVHNIDDYFADGKHARYETAHKLAIDRDTCRVVDRGEESTILIEDGIHRIKVDVTKHYALRYAQSGSTDQAAARAGGEHLSFAGESCTASSDSRVGTKICLWDKLPFYPLAKGHVAPVQLMTDMTLQGQPVTHVEATVFHLNEAIPAKRFQVPAGIEIKGE